MAKITNFLDEGSLDTIFDEASFGIENASKRKIEFEDGFGAHVEIHGTGLTVSHGRMTGGTVTSAEVLDANGHMLFKVEHAHLSAAQISDDFATYGVVAIGWAFAAGNDIVLGSKNTDILNGSDGDDVMLGHGGDDNLLGARGNDILTGGAGNDAFVFFKSCGVDTATDFRDEGSNQDVIWTTRRMYHSMEIDQHGHDVVLDFGSGDQLIIENARAADIGKDDFHFN